ncbi:MAG TPA: glucose-6-phosphate isomerase [bacterium]|nr:glucose-6-phosphate isomerase [bacterium]
MTLNADIRLDFNFMMSEFAGGAGLSRDDVEAVRPQASQIHRGVQELRKLGQMPFLDLAHYTDDLKGLKTLASELRSRCRKALILGIGGSALGPRLLVEALGSEEGMDVEVCDSLDAEGWTRTAARSDPERTLLVVISKSGKTLETWAAFVYFFEKFRAALGEKAWRQMVAVTDSEKGALRQLSQEKGFPCLKIPPGVGGRFSVLSPVGLLPAALAGADVDSLLAGARRMEERCATDDPWLNPALMSAILHERFEVLRKRNIRVLISYAERFRSFGPWMAQLWAESLGKSPMGGAKPPVGSTPVSSFGPRDQHSQLQLYLDGPADKIVTFLGIEEGAAERLSEAPDWARVLGEEAAQLSKKKIHELTDASRLATEEALRARGRPNQTVLLKDGSAYDLGQLLLMCELETVYAGQLLGVNPFDQPAVEQIKRNVREFLTGKITPSKSRNYMI